REVVRPSSGCDQPREATHQHPSPRVPHVEEHEPSWRIVGRYDHEGADVRESTLNRAAAVRRIVEGDTGEPYAIEPSFEDGRHPVPPRWETQDECFRRAQAFHIRFDSSQIAAHLIVRLPFGERHHRIEAFCMEVKIVDVMTTRLETKNDLPM